MSVVVVVVFCPDLFFVLFCFFNRCALQGARLFRWVYFVGVMSSDLSNCCTLRGMSPISVFCSKVFAHEYFSVRTGEEMTHKRTEYTLL